MKEKITSLALSMLFSVSTVFAQSSPQKQSPWSTSTAITLGDAYWTRPGFFPTHKEGPVIQPEISISHNSELGKVSGYAWLNQNIDSGLSAEGTHELDLGIAYNFPSIVKTDKTQAGFFLDSAWWEYGIAGKLGESHPIIESGIWFNRKLSEKVSIDAKVSGLRLLGEEGSNGWMIDTKLALPLKMSYKITVAPTLTWTYLDGVEFYGSKEGTAHIRGILPINYTFGKGYTATLGVRAQKGFNGKDDKLGGFLRLQKDF